jgi:GMP synthase (glutamine-hydrolysing)
MTRVLIVDSNGPGLPALGQCFAAVLHALLRQITCSRCAPYLGQAPPEGVFDGVVFTGLGVAWCVDAPEGWILRYIRRQVTRWKVPNWGSCNGMQLAAFKMGGVCAASSHGDEDGLAEAITSTDIGRYDPMMQRPPVGARLLAGNTHSLVQAFAYDTANFSFWGMQYHPEFSIADFATWLADRGKPLPDTEEWGGQGDLALATWTLELQNWHANVTPRHRTTGAK